MPTNLPRAMEDTERRAAGTSSGQYTSPQPPPQPPVQRKPEQKWIERKAPVFVEFKAPGEFVEGRLLSVRVEEMEDKQSHQKKRIKKYLVRDGADAYEFIGTWDINKKLSESDVGLTIRVTFKGEKDVGKGNLMKEFEVMFQERVQNDGRPEITDEDIPF